MNKVISQDGTTIAYDKMGEGPAVILVDGALCYRAFGPSTVIAKLLARKFTVYTYDRRGRGDSGDTQPYTIEKEIEDLEVLINEAGGSAYLFGQSSGAALGLEAAVKLKGIKKLAMYEAPFFIDNSHAPLSDTYLSHIKELIAQDRRGEAVKLFMRTVDVPKFFLLLMPLMPMWGKLKGVAHTLPYDFTITLDNQKGRPFSPKKWEKVKIPILVMNGGKSPAWMRNGMKSLAGVLEATYKELEGQTHNVKAEVLVPELEKFFKK